MTGLRSPERTRQHVRCPFSLQVDVLARMLNFELSDHPVYDGGELQWFDDPVHGTGMLVFLSRRDSGRVDYYQQPGLRIDRSGYGIGTGTGAWVEVDFDVARLAVTSAGVDAEVRFSDVDGRSIEVRVDDRSRQRRRPAGLLAPISASIEQPTSMLLVWLPRFDLVRVTGTPPLIRIDGVDASTGHLPGRRLHGRHLIKYAAPVVAVHINRVATGPWPDTGDQQVVVGPGDGIRELVAEQAGHRARLVLDPVLPDLASVAGGQNPSGRWRVEVDRVRLTGGTWSLTRTGGDIALEMAADEPWRPGRLPWLMRMVTTVLPVFRRWPTTYRWHADIRLDGEPTLTGRWSRTGSERGDSYRDATAAQR